MKQNGEKISCLTAYDASFALLMEQAGVEILLVGDSLGMVIQGNDSTLSVTMEQLIYHCSCVSKNTQKALIMADMPFATCYDKKSAYKNAAKLMAQGGAQMVKIEGGKIMQETVAYLSERSIPVCSHLGLLPQSVYRLGGYKKQGKTAAEFEQILHDAQVLEQAGADMLLLECVPSELTSAITSSVSIPVIGIGAGKSCDAQVLVSYDVLGLSANQAPSFSKNFLQNTSSSNPVLQAFESYVKAVKNGEFPTN